MVGKLRPAQNTIIGSTFIILIIISTYGLYLSYTSNQRSYDQIQRDMRNRDFERQNEMLGYYYEVEDDPKKVELNIQNVGSLSARIIYIIDVGKTILQYPTDFNLAPGNNLTIAEILQNENINITGSSIQLVSERGKTYQTLYEPTKDKPTSRRELNDFLEALTHTFGDYIIDYHSWGWAIARDSNRYSQEFWENTWSLPNKIDLVFRINVTYYGELEPMIINQSTLLDFYESQSSSVIKAYIVANIGDYNNEHLEGYSSDNLLQIWWGENVTFYFGADSIGGAPEGIRFSPSVGHNNIFTAMLVISDPYREYAQSFPLIGIKIV